jgi:hypothetical protein
MAALRRPDVRGARGPGHLGAAPQTVQTFRSCIVLPVIFQSYPPALTRLFPCDASLWRNAEAVRLGIPAFPGLTGRSSPAGRPTKEPRDRPS